MGNTDDGPGSLDYEPVRFLYRSVPPDELTAIYAVADVCFICSTRDGLNLVCYEYIACHGDNNVPQTVPPGTLILSKFVGASTTLDGYLKVDPWDTAGCAEAITQALTMDPSEVRVRMSKLKSEVASRTRYVRGVSPVCSRLANCVWQLPMGAHLP